MSQTDANIGVWVDGIPSFGSERPACPSRQRTLQVSPPVIDNILVGMNLAVGAATVAAAVFAGLQVRHYVADQRTADKVAVDGVSLMWRIASAPYHPNFDDDRALWKLEFMLTNPGRMPIDGVTCTVTFDRPVQRLHSGNKLDDATSQFQLHQVVLAGGSSRSWERTIVAQFIDGRRLDNAIRAKVAFKDVNGMSQLNHWPRASRAVTN